MPVSVSAKQLRNEILLLVQDYASFNNEYILELPNSWEKYNDLVLFQKNCFTSPFWADMGEKLWILICNRLKCKRIGLKGCVTNDDFRTPKVSLVYGEPGDVSFTDNGIKYTWDLEHSMFCRGNLSERHRIANLDCHNEVIVDLFAGIGYFTLPYLVKAKAKLVHACEWNPFAIKALRKNLEINNVFDKCIIYEGDNRQFAPKCIGNRINVGLIPDSEGFWKIACESLLSSGGIIYIHENVTSEIHETMKSATCEKCLLLIEKCKELHSGFCVAVSGSPPFVWNVTDLNIAWKHLEWFHYSLHISHCLIDHLENFHKGKRWVVTIKEYFRVKSYAPHIDHLVYAAYCSSD